MKLCLVNWHDAHAEAYEWTDITEVGKEGPYLVKSAGWLLESDRGAKPGHISIAQSLTCDQNVDSVIHIPQAMVVSVQTFDDPEATNEQANLDQIGSHDCAPLPKADPSPRVGGRAGSPRPDRKDRKNRNI